MKKLIRLLGSVSLLLSASAVFAGAPAGYYNSLVGKKDAELKLAAHNLVKNFTRISGYSDLPNYFRRTDVYPGGERWWDMYSDIPLYTRSFSGLNREHSFPKSWWGGSTTVSAYVDLNHLYPSEMRANTAKSNYPLGVVDKNHVDFQNGVVYVGIPVAGQGGGARFVFEPDDEYKGDFARTYFYMATTYQDFKWKYKFMVNDNPYPTLNQWSIDLLLKWHRDDPVSEKEINRNEIVYGYQGNRNPFIDEPALAEYIWGEYKGQAFKLGSGPIPPEVDPELLAPAKNTTLDFGQVALGQSVTSKVFVRTISEKNPVEVLLYSGDSKQFKVGTTSIPANLSNSEEGYWLNVTYTPDALGEHTSRVLLSGDFVGSRGVALLARCLPVPTLHACTATSPTNITENSYTANWTVPSEDVVDYFIVTRISYVGGQPTQTEILVENDDEGRGSVEITGFDLSDNESYSVQSVRLGYRSPMSNVIFVAHGGVTGVETEEPLTVQGFEGFLRVFCSAPQPALTVYDLAGRVVYTQAEVSANTDIYVPTGIYFVTTGKHATPVKVVVR